MKKNVLVTGGAGYIGSHACKLLKRAGYCPVTLDNFSTGWRGAVKFGPLVECDLRDTLSLRQVFSAYKPVAVMHFAGSSQVGESVIKPDLYWANNVINSLNLINAAIEHSCENFIFSSTCATYGDQDGVLLDESSLQLPNNPYARSKFAVEGMLKDFAVTEKLKFVIFRYFNVAGADEDAEIGEYHQPETHLIPIILNTMLGMNDHLTIYGTDYETIDGTCVRDYIHVSDLVEAHLLGLKWLQYGNDSCVYNLGTGRGFSVREVISEAQSVTKKQIRVIEGERRVGDCATLVSASTLAKTRLGWTAKRSNLKKMISDAWRWRKSLNYNSFSK